MYDAQKWVENIFKIIGKFDIIYTPNEWMRNLFLRKKCNIATPEFYKKKEYNGAIIRDLISKNNEKWKNLVPKKVSELIIRFNGVKRIKILYEK